MVVKDLVTTMSAQGLPASGVVGSGAYEVLKNYGYEVKKILDIRPHDELGDVLTSNYDDILNDKEIGVVAEAIGGLEPAHTFVVKALKAGKHVYGDKPICTSLDELSEIRRISTEKGLKISCGGPCNNPKGFGLRTGGE